MGRLSLVLLLGAAAAALVSCAPKPAVGDSRGGYIDWYATTKAQVLAGAEEHCAAYRKKARLVNTESDKSGGHATFVCE